jgi:signal transduction histidine kinase
LKRTLGVRTRLLLAVVLSVTLATIILVGAFNYVLASRLSDNAITAARARAEGVVSSLQVRNGQIVLGEAPDAGVVGSLVWIFGPGGKALEAPNADRRLQQAAVSLALAGVSTRELGSLRARLYGVPVISGRRRLGYVVAAVSTKPYDDTRTTALVASLVLAACLLAALTLAARWMLGAALRPVTEMTASAATWSERDLDRRFRRGVPYDELTELAATLDALLDRLATSLRREQHFAAELSHELRTPLTRISGEAELALDRERTSAEYRKAFDSIYRDARQMTRIVDALISAARQEAGFTRATSDARDAVTRSVETARPLADAREIELVTTLPRAPARIAVEGELAERILQPLLENACQYGRSRVEVSVVEAGEKTAIHVTDDGPGVVAEEQQTIFDPGMRGRAAAGREGGSGLGLALAQRLARSAGGTISVRPGGRGGHFIVELPPV